MSWGSYLICIMMGMVTVLVAQGQGLTGLSDWRLPYPSPRPRQATEPALGTEFRDAGGQGLWEPQAFPLQRPAWRGPRVCLSVPGENRRLASWARVRGTASSLSEAKPSGWRRSGWPRTGHGVIPAPAASSKSEDTVSDTKSGAVESQRGRGGKSACAAGRTWKAKVFGRRSLNG